MYQQLASQNQNPVAKALTTRAPPPGPVGPTQQTLPLAQALMGQPTGQSRPVTGDTLMDMYLMTNDPTEFAKLSAAQSAPTDLMKNVRDPSTAPYVQKDLYTTGAGGVPIPYS